MGKNYTAKLADGSKRMVASPSNGHARLFYELAQVAEKFVGLPSGITDDNGEDEHIVEAEQFLRFFERFWQEGWLGERKGLLYAWAQEAAGIIENITLTPREWIDRSGEKLEVRRYLRDEEFRERLIARGVHVSDRYPKA